jgi:hypothetical protein
MRDYYELFVFCSRDLIRDDVLATAFLMSWPLYSKDPIPVMGDIKAYGEDFAAANGEAWDQLRSTLRLAVPVPDLATVCRTIRDRIGSVLETINNPSVEIAA